MAYSKVKFYRNLNLSHTARMKKPKRYLKESFGKESILEKPYKQGRNEMHSDIPNYRPFNFDLDMPLPELPIFPPFPPLPPIPQYLLPQFPELPRLRRVVNEPDKVRPELEPDKDEPRPEDNLAWMVQAECNIEGGPESMEKGDVGFLNAAANNNAGGIWGIENSHPELIQTNIIYYSGSGNSKSGPIAARIKIILTGIGDTSSDEVVRICVNMADARLIKGRAGGFPVSECGCINIDYSASDITEWAIDAGSGTVQRNDVTWNGAQTGAGQSVDTTITRVRAADHTTSFTVNRGFIVFDLSAHAGKVATAVTITSEPGLGVAVDVAITEGTQGDVVNASDFQGTWVGTFFARDDSSGGPNNEWIWTLDAAGIAYVNSVMGSKAYFAFKEYDHDYLGIQPTGGDSNQAVMRDVGGAYNMKIVITL